MGQSLPHSLAEASCFQKKKPLSYGLVGMGMGASEKRREVGGADILSSFTQSFTSCCSFSS